MHMRKHRSSNGKPMNWVNYPSDVKDIYIRLEVDGEGVRLCVDIQPKDDGIRAIIWEQFTELKTVLLQEMEVDPIWNESSHSIGGKQVSRVYWETRDLNYYRDEDIPQIQDWLEDKLLRFDRFYQEYKEILINLVA
ncbi:MAG: hypothetical protein A3D92_19355 [Bacteroidetes bacterium RIFCSPHIGHO2_02_FULL_44_7]|nr:MAG: hypothetical protein A3D92_19355 [Bacteroidetes bacterium RIFCSPHIGHO2_02_FULL_44_7]